MSALFYVKDGKGNLVPAQFLNVNGQPVADPNIQNAQNIHLYDASGVSITDGNPNGYLIAPTNYSLDQAASFGQTIKGEMLGDPPTQALADMIGAFIRGGSQDLQRNYVDVNGDMVNNGPAVLAFQELLPFTWAPFLHTRDYLFRGLK